MRRQTILAAAASLLALSIAAPAVAQSPTPPSSTALSIGDSIEGEIAEGDAAAAEDAYRYDLYAINARSGQRLDVVMRSEAFDTMLEVFREGEADEPLASDDDGLGEGTDSRLRFTADQDGAYLLRARTLSGPEGGAYTLSLTERPPAGPAPRPGRIRVGQTVEGRLGSNDPESDDGLTYDAFAFRAREGQRFAIDLRADGFDPLVRIGRMQGGAFTELAMNDDGPEGLNSHLVFTAPEGGEYVIRATPLNTSGEGTYSLSLAEGPEPAAAQAIEIGASVEGALGDDDGKSAAGVATDAWRFQGQAGQRVRIEMTSDDFDAYLELFDENRVSLAQDDDGGEGTNARLTVTLPQTGSYIVEARSFSEATGDYALSITGIEPERPPEVLPFGSTIEGEIGESDSSDDEDREFDAFSFSGREGQRVQAIMRSGDFDTYLQVGAAEGEFSALASDDDGLGEGTDSRLTFSLPEDGDYVLRASPLGGDGKGLYSLELIDRGPQPSPGSLLVGATARGTLTESDATAEDNSFYDAYRVSLKEDEKLVVTMVSNEVDSFVLIGRTKEDGEFEVLGSDDDSLSDTHAKLEWTVPSDGAYEVRAGTFQQGQTGSYALNVDKQP
jgi:hypothetical protein